MNGDVWTILLWFTMLLGLGLIIFPILWVTLTKHLADGGFGVSGVCAIVVVSWTTWILSSLHLLPFALATVSLVIVALLMLSVVVLARIREELKIWIRSHVAILLFEITLCFASLVFWSWVRGFQPDVQGLEKFMDAGFVNSIVRSQWMPPADPWLAGSSINYYYFGHFEAALLTVLSGLDSAVTYNLMLTTIFALVMTGAFSVIYNFVGGGKGGFIGGVLGTILLNFGGNLHTMWHFLTNQQKPYWYPDATRFIEYTIHEFPAYSHIVADLHGHLLNLPTMLLLLVLLVAYIKQRADATHKKNDRRYLFPCSLGFLLGLASMANTWDVPIYGLVTILALFITNVLSYRSRKDAFIVTGIQGALVGSVALVVSLPFHLHFVNFAKGIALVGAHSPTWQLGVLWGGFALISLVALWWFLCVERNMKEQSLLWTLPIVCIFMFILLVSIPEIIYVKDIYIREYHRANTMFKLTYQAFVMMCLVFGMTIGRMFSHKTAVKKVLYSVALFCLLSVCSVHMMYPFFSIKSYYAGLKEYKGLYGLSFLSRSYPDDYNAILWMKQNISGQPAPSTGGPVVLEAVGESYTDFSRVSTFTGLPTVIGWRVHEWLWRGSFDEAGKRTEEVKAMYEQPLSAQSQMLFQKYAVKYIFVGALERQIYKLHEVELQSIGSLIFQSENTLVIALQ